MKNKILFIEDNPDDAELVIHALSRLHIVNEVVVKKDEKEIFDLLHSLAHNDKPTFILLDLKIGKLNGLDILRKLKSDESLKMIPVIILTSSRKETDILDGYQIGANSYIVKPIDSIKFFEAMQTVGLYWLAINQKPTPE